MRLSALIAHDFRNLEGRIPLCDPLAVTVGGNMLQMICSGVCRRLFT